MTAVPPGAGRRFVSDRPLDLGLTLGLLARGPYDPTFRRVPGSTGIEFWRTSRLSTGSVTYRLAQTGPRAVVGQAWGPGAAELLEALPALVGEDDDATAFTPPPPLRDIHRRAHGMRIPRTGRVLEALIPSVLEQRVQTVTAWHAWGRLLRRHGDAAPGPSPPGMYVVPDATTWATIPSWEYHRAGVDPRRTRTVVTVARTARRLEECAHLEPAAARARMGSLPGVGPWTTAEVAARALGDADAVPVGDFHLPAAVGLALAGERGDDERMLQLLAPYTPHRFRVIRLLEIARLARTPRRGPKLAFQDHRAS